MTQPIQSLYPNFSWAIGVVEDRNDPQKLGRCRVRVMGYHTEKKTGGGNVIATKDLPWASPLSPISSAAVSDIGHAPVGLIEGTWVVVLFRDAPKMQEMFIAGAIAGMPQEQPKPIDGFADPQENENRPWRPKEIKYNSDGSGVEIEEGEDTGYPRLDRLGESDTNRLARNDKNQEHEVVTRKKQSIDKNVPTSSAHYMGSQTKQSEEFSEPETPYDALYPYNHVFESESGHVQEFDDTKGKERYHRYHRAGSFIEIHPDGQQVEKVVMDDYNIVLKNAYSHIDGRYWFTVDKGFRLFINKDEESGADYDIEVGSNGDLNITVKQGDVNINVLDGNLTNYVNGDVEEHITGDVTRKIDGDLTEKIGGDVTRQIQGSETETIQKYRMTQIQQYDIRQVQQHVLDSIQQNKIEMVMQNKISRVQQNEINTVGMMRSETITMAYTLRVTGALMLNATPILENC